MNTRARSATPSRPSLAPDILRPRYMYRAHPQLREIQNETNSSLYASVQRSVRRWLARTVNNIARLAGDDPVYSGWIMPYHSNIDGEMCRDDFRRLREQVNSNLRCITGLPGIKGVAGYFLPYYLHEYGRWFAMAKIVVFGNAPADYLAAAVSSRLGTYAPLRRPDVQDAVSTTRFQRGSLHGPWHATEASAHIIPSLAQPDVDPTQLGRFVAGLRKSDLLILRGIHQMPGGRLAFKN